MAKQFNISDFLFAIQVTYLLFLSITTRPPIKCLIKFNISRFPFTFKIDITIRTRKFLEFLGLSTVIVPSPSSNPNQKGSIYSLFNLKIFSLPKLGSNNNIELLNNVIKVLSCNAKSRLALERTIPVTKKISLIYRYAVAKPRLRANSFIIKYVTFITTTYFSIFLL